MIWPQKRILLLLVMLISYAAVKAQEKRHWQFELLSGLAYTAPTPLVIKQNGYPTLKLKAHYQTQSLQLPIYYSYRFTTIKSKKGWSLEMNHLKIYLQNKTDEITRFHISHGYNHLFINRHIQYNKIECIMGAGAVIVHPENTIRGQALPENKGLFNEGYYISGITTQAALQWPIIKTKYFLLPLETKISMSYATVPISGGKAHVPVIAFSLLSGICGKL